MPDRIFIPVQDLLLNCLFYKHSQYYALKRIQTSMLLKHLEGGDSLCLEEPFYEEIFVALFLGLG